jgi:hypothetical protein
MVQPLTPPARFSQIFTPEKALPQYDGFVAKLVQVTTDSKFMRPAGSTSVTLL